MGQWEKVARDWRDVSVYSFEFFCGNSTSLSKFTFNSESLCTVNAMGNFVLKPFYLVSI